MSIEVVWADQDWLAAQGVRQWTQIPLWRVAAGTWAIEATRAAEAGLRRRPLGETVADTWALLAGSGRPVPHERQAEHGIDPGAERQLIARWDALRGVAPPRSPSPAAEQRRV